jgi:putative ABC transport system substrate-binding protein
MLRREFISFLGGAAAFWPRVAVAQVAGRRPLVAILAGQTAAAGLRYSSVLVQRMKDLGYIEGRDIEFSYFHADGDMGRLPSLAVEMVRLRPDVVVATNIQAVVAARQASNVIPVIGTVLTDPTELGLVATHAKPGGNVTGILVSLDTLLGKQVALATEVVRRKAKWGLLMNASSPTQASQRKHVEHAAAALATALVSAEITSSAELEGAFRALADEQVDGVVVLGDPMLFFERARVAELAIAVRLPTVFGLREHVEAGGLMSYGIDQRASFRRAAEMVDKILKGARPGELPVELPTKFELVVNLKTAKAINISVPENFLVRADEVIE